MRPSLIEEILADIVPDCVHESQSLDTRPDDEGIFITVAFEEQPFVRGIRRGAQTMTVAAHQSWDESRDYGPLTDLLNEFNIVFQAVENETGADGVRVSCIIPEALGRNTVDEGWKTITRTATYRVLHAG